MSDVFHVEGGLHFSATKGRVPGPDPQGHSYFSFASFSDPDGNGWLLQEIKARLPGRGFGVDVASLTELLREAELHHGKFEPTAPKHHWSGFTPPTSSRASAARLPRRQPKTPRATSPTPSLHDDGSR